MVAPHPLRRAAIDEIKYRVSVGVRREHRLVGGCPEAATDRAARAKLLATFYLVHSASESRC